MRQSDGMSWTEFHAGGQTSSVPSKGKNPGQQRQMSNKKPFDYKERKASESAESKLNSLADERSDKSRRPVDVLR